MRFHARGLWILDSEHEFNFPICYTHSDAKKLACILNKLAGDSE